MGVTPSVMHCRARTTASRMCSWKAAAAAASAAAVVASRAPSAAACSQGVPEVWPSSHALLVNGNARRSLSQRVAALHRRNAAARELQSFQQS